MLDVNLESANWFEFHKCFVGFHWNSAKFINFDHSPSFVSSFIGNFEQFIRFRHYPLHRAVLNFKVKGKFVVGGKLPETYAWFYEFFALNKEEI